MRRLLLLSLPLAVWLFLSWAAVAGLSRAAMVTETSGDAKLANKPVRTLQVFAEGSEISVGQGGKLRLVYLQSGQKEDVSGPCLLRIGSSASQLVSGEGTVTEVQASGSTTKLRRSENIRRMGGTLQANVRARPEQSPGEVLAMLEVPSDDPGSAAIPGSRSSGLDDWKLRMFMTPVVSFSADSFQKLSWRGGRGPFRVTLSCNGEVVVPTTVVPGESWEPPKVRFIPGQIYELRIDDEGARDGLTHSFMVLLPSERAEFEANVSDFSQMLGGSERDRFVTRIGLAEEWGLWLEALEYSEDAVEAFPEDAGFQAALGRALFNLGQFREAQSALQRAEKLEATP